MAEGKEKSYCIAQKRSNQQAKGNTTLCNHNYASLWRWCSQANEQFGFLPNVIQGKLHFGLIRPDS